MSNPITTPLKNLAMRLALRAVGGMQPSMSVQQALAQYFAMSIGDRHPATLAQQEANRSWVFASNRQIAGRATRIEPVMELVQRQGGTAPKRQIIHDHPFLDLLAQPNADLTGKTFHWQLVTQLQTAGRVYVLVEPAIIDLSKLIGGTPKFITSRIARMQLLEPERVRPLSTYGRRAAAFEYFDLYGGKGLYPAAPSNAQERESWKKNPQPFVVRIFIPAPDSWNGQSPTEAADWAIKTLFGLTQLWQNQLQNGLHAGLIFYLEKKGMAELERFEKAVAIVRAGIGKAGQPLVLPKETVSVDKSPLSMADMSFENLANLTRKEVLATQGTSDGLVGITESANRSSITGIERIAALGTIDPLNSLVADAWTNWVLPLYAGQSDTSWYEIKYPSSQAIDEIEEAGRLTELVSGSIMTPNEARATLGMGPVPGGDKLTAAQAAETQMHTLNTQLEMHKASLAVSGAKQPGMLGSGDKAGESNVNAAPSAIKQADKAAEERRRRRSTKTTRRVKRSHALAALQGTDGYEARRAKWRSLQADRKKSEARFRRGIAPIFARWRNAVVAELKAKGPEALSRAVREDSESPYVAEFAAVYTKWSSAWSEQVIGRVLDDLGLDASEVESVAPDVIDSMRDWIASRSNDMAAQIVDTQQLTLEAAVEDAVAEGLAVSAMVEAVEASFPGVDDFRTKMIAATEATIAEGFAAFASGDEAGDFFDSLPDDDPRSGDTVGLLWLSRRDNRVRDSHSEADGDVVSIGESFIVGGDEMRYPGDDSLGADSSEICNCRCSCVVVPLDHDEGWSDE